MSAAGLVDKKFAAAERAAAADAQRGTADLALRKSAAYALEGRRLMGIAYLLRSFLYSSRPSAARFPARRDAASKGDAAPIYGKAGSVRS